MDKLQKDLNTEYNEQNHQHTMTEYFESPTVAHLLPVQYYNTLVPFWISSSANMIIMSGYMMPLLPQQKQFAG